MGVENGQHAQISRPLPEQAQEDAGPHEGSMIEIDFAGVLGLLQKHKILKKSRLALKCCL